MKFNLRGNEALKCPQGLKASSSAGSTARLEAVPCYLQRLKPVMRDFRIPRSTSGNEAAKIPYYSAIHFACNDFQTPVPRIASREKGMPAFESTKPVKTQPENLKFPRLEPCIFW